MSTLKVTNIQATGETASRAVSGVAAAWVNYIADGTQSINDSFNIASITDNGTGLTLVTLSASMLNNDYSATTGGWDSAYYLGISSGAIKTSSTCLFAFGNTSNTATDANEASGLIHGDLA